MKGDLEFQKLSVLKGKQKFVAANLCYLLNLNLLAKIKNLISELLSSQLVGGFLTLFAQQ